MVSSPTHLRPGRPAVDAPLVAEDSGYEIIEGRLVPVPPSHEPHGDRHSKLNALLEAHVNEEFNVACDMLTRASETTNLAPDASVYPIARDPVTGGRQLEQLAFEIVSTQSLTDAGERARLLAERGVRRVFAIDVSHQRVFEWSRDADDWQLTTDATAIDDQAFAVPLPVEALAKAAKADDTIATALLAKGNRVLAAAIEEGVERGRKAGLERGRQDGLEAARRTLLAIADAKALNPTPAQRDRITGCTDLAQLEAWTVALLATPDLDRVLTD